MGSRGQATPNPGERPPFITSSFNPQSWIKPETILRKMINMRTRTRRLACGRLQFRGLAPSLQPTGDCDGWLNSRRKEADLRAPFPARKAEPGRDRHAAPLCPGRALS